MRYLSERSGWLFFAATGFALLFACFIYDAQRESTAKSQLRKAGIAVTLQELKARYTAEPKEDNGAFLYLQAKEKIKNLDPDKLVQLPIAGDLEYEYGQVLSREQRNALHEYVSMNEAAIALILESQTRPFSRFPDSRYDSLVLSYLSHSRVFGRLLCCAALDAALSGDMATMDRMIVAGLRLPEVLSEGGFLIDALVANALRAIAISSVENCLYFVTPPKEVLRTWLDILGQKQYTTLEVHQDAFRNETTYGHRFFSFDSTFSPSNQSLPLNGVLEIIMASEWTQYNYFSYNHYIQAMISIINAADKDVYTVAKMPADDYPEDAILERPRYALSAILLPALANAYVSHVISIARATTIRTALAALLYLEDHGRFPDTLDDLVPDYLPAAPRDPFTPDGTIRYRIRDDLAVFYSIGPNEQDDGGTEPTDYILTSGDIIFRLPLVEGNHDKS